MSAFWLEIWERHIRKKASPALLLRVILERIDREAADPQYLRIKADGHFFFTHMLLFADAPEPSQLKPGQVAHVGAHRLDDGCFWLHWLRTESGAELVPRDDAALVAKKQATVATGKTLLYLGCAILAILFLVSFFPSKTNAVLIPLAGIACLGLIGYGGYLIRHGAAFTRAVRGEKWQTLRNGLDRIRERDDTGFTALSCGDPIQGDPNPAYAAPDNLRRGVDFVSGPISKVASSRREGQSASIGDTEVSGPQFTVYAILCGNRSIGYPGHAVTEQTFANVHPSVLDKRFLFLVRGDRITAIMNTHEGLLRQFVKITPATGDAEAAALINHEDGHVATSMSVQLHDPRNIQLAVGLVCGVTLVCISAMAALMAISRDAAGMLSFPIFTFFAMGIIWASLCLLWEVGKNGVLLLTGEASKHRQWEERVSALMEYLAPGPIQPAPPETWTRVAKRVAFLAAVGCASLFFIMLMF